ncbi:hypothetical protein LTR17_021604 [Elasticomyces elasticus]|nr:hypothetical protein LTR17_021604 [Elasticomyces elasticus]
MDPKAKLMQQHCALHLRPEAFEEFRGIAITYTRDQELPLTAAAADDFTVGLLALYGLKLWPKGDDHRKHLVSDSGPSSGLVYRPLPTSHKKKDIVDGPRMYQDEGFLRSEHGKTPALMPWSDLSDKTKQEWEAKAGKVVAFLNVKHEKAAREAVLKSELGVLLSSYYLAMLEYPRGVCVHNKPKQMVARITACIDSGAGKRGSPRKSTGKSVSGVAEASNKASPLGDAHAALFLQPAMSDTFKALVIRHTLDMGLQLSASACQELTISFMRVYAMVLWPRSKTSRQHLIEEGVGGPMYTYVLEQPLPDTNDGKFTGFQAFRESYIPTILLSSPDLQPHQVEWVVQSNWQILPAAEQGNWERRAYERSQIWGRQCIEHSHSVALKSRLGKLISAYFTALLGCEPFDNVDNTSDALLAKIWSFRSPEVNGPQLGYRPDTQQAVHEESMAPAAVTDVASFWTKFEQETE